MSGTEPTTEVVIQEEGEKKISKQELKRLKKQQEQEEKNKLKEEERLKKEEEKKKAHELKLEEAAKKSFKEDDSLPKASKIHIVDAPKNISQRVKIFGWPQSSKNCNFCSFERRNWISSMCVGWNSF
jgi:hypothetical protein